MTDLASSKFNRHRKLLLASILLALLCSLTVIWHINLTVPLDGFVKPSDLGETTRASLNYRWELKNVTFSCVFDNADRRAVAESNLGLAIAGVKQFKIDGLQFVNTSQTAGPLGDTNSGQTYVAYTNNRYIMLLIGITPDGEFYCYSQQKIGMQRWWFM